MSRVYTVAQKERIRECARLRYADNREKFALKNATWRAANPDFDRERKEKWYAANRDKERKRATAWSKANPERTAAHTATRRARVAGSVAKLTADEKARVTGFYAQARAMTKLMGEPYHVDHKKPLSKGGLHHPDNLQVLRGIDNLKKGAKYG